MSKLVALLSSSQYNRLDTLDAHSPNVANPKSFSVRNQSGQSENNAQDPVKIQANAVDFFGNTQQDGFTTFKPTLSTNGFRKTDTSKDIASDFTGDANFNDLPTTTQAFYTYNRYALDNLRTQYKSKLIHKYLATDTTKQYSVTDNWPETPEGLLLTYNPPE